MLNEDVELCAWKILMEVVDFSIQNILKWSFNSLKLFDSTLFLSQAFGILCLFPAKMTFFHLFMRLFNDIIEPQPLSACYFHAVVRGYFSLLKEKCSRCTSPALFLSSLVWSHYHPDQHLRTSGSFVHSWEHSCGAGPHHSRDTENHAWVSQPNLVPFRNPILEPAGHSTPLTDVCIPLLWFRCCVVWDTVFQGGRDDKVRSSNWDASGGTLNNTEAKTIAPARSIRKQQGSV